MEKGTLTCCKGYTISPEIETSRINQCENQEDDGSRIIMHIKIVDCDGDIKRNASYKCHHDQRSWNSIEVLAFFPIFHQPPPLPLPFFLSQHYQLFFCTYKLATMR